MIDKCVFSKQVGSSCTSQNMSWFLVDSARKPGGLKQGTTNGKTAGMLGRPRHVKTAPEEATKLRGRLGGCNTWGIRGFPGCTKSWRFFFGKC